MPPQRPVHQNSTKYEPKRGLKLKDTERKAREMRETWAAQEQWKKETGDKRRERAEKREREAAASLQSEPDKENQPAEPAAEAAEPYEESQRF